MSLELKIQRTREVLAEIERDYSPATFANSFGVEDMVLTDMIAKDFRSIEIFSLDTGRLPPETYDLMQKTTEHYRRKIKVYFPESAAVENYVRINGINGFYESIAQRKDCCHVRKVEPLKRALTGKKAWITGLRREQAPTRSDLGVSEFDKDHNLQKFNPLIDWTHLDVWTYISTHKVPYNILHDKGYPSIGCAPCTRAIQPGEDVRAGRWWWESADHKECGLHVKPQAT
ncbi:MAG TPA: phosphoadenylyl-sulfate reductase [Burkholderiales bacterium]|nr:phosphoadenylyl-sulfate reductase [Burkholderiales bacterium]